MAAYFPDIQFIQFLQFGRPEFFWLLAALPVLWLRFHDRRLVVTLAHTLIATLLIFALADPQTVS